MYMCFAANTVGNSEPAFGWVLVDQSLLPFIKAYFE